jgi:hypothetical protein
VSVAVAHAQSLTGKNKVARTVIRGFTARDARSLATVALQPGELIESYRIQRIGVAADTDDGVYVMDFESSGRHLRCPLVQFQARTQSILSHFVEEAPAREAATTP